MKTTDELITEKAQIVEKIVNDIDNFLHAKHIRFDEALLALLSLFMYKLEKDIIETNSPATMTVEELRLTPIQDVLQGMVHDSVQLSIDKQARESN